MRNEFTAVVERHGRWHIACCPEIPGANGQGKTKAATLENLRDAIALILEDRRKDGLRGVPDVLARKICRGLSVPELGRGSQPV
jgi:predicted RNase H-like HicB family nuclease